MTWTYTNTHATNRDRVRHLIRDTDSSRQILQNEEIDWHLTNSTNVWIVAAECCEVIAAKFGRMIDRSAVGISDSPQSTAKFWTDLADKYRRRANSTLSVFAGGRSVQGKADLANEDDATQPAFAVGLDDAPNAVDQNAGEGRYNVGD